MGCWHMRGSRKCPTRLWQRFLADEMREDSKYQQKQAIIGLSAKRHLNFFELHKMLELNQLIRILFMRSSRIICQRGSKLTSFLGGWEYPQMPLKVAHHWPFERAIHWRANGGPTMRTGLVAVWFSWGFVQVLLRNIYIFAIFCGGRTPYTLPPSRSVHVVHLVNPIPFYYCLACWIWICLPNINIDPNQMATEVAIWSRSTLFLTLFLAGFGVDPLSPPSLWICACCSYV